MTRKTELMMKLEQAQSLLAEVYHFACNGGHDELIREMSMADSMIIDAKEELERIYGME